MLNVFLGRGVGFAFDQDGIGEFLSSEAGLFGAANMIEEERLQDFDGLVAVDFQRALGEAIDLAFALLVGTVFGLAPGLDGNKAGVAAAGIFFVANSLVEELPQADELAAF